MLVMSVDVTSSSLPSVCESRPALPLAAAGCSCSASVARALPAAILLAGCFALGFSQPPPNPLSLHVPPAGRHYRVEALPPAGADPQPGGGCLGLRRRGHTLRSVHGGAGPLAALLRGAAAGEVRVAAGGCGGGGPEGG